MNTILLIISCFILIFFLKDIVAILIALCIFAICFYYLVNYTDNTFIQNIFVSSESN